MKNMTVSEKSGLKMTNGKNRAMSGKGWFRKPGCEFRKKREIMYRFMRPLRPFLKELDKLICEIPVFDQVMNENMEHGFKGSYPTLRINYPKVILTKGKLPNPPALSVCSPKPGRLVFRWADNSGIQESLPSDLLFIGVFNRKLVRWIFKVDVAERSACRYSINASSFRGKPVQVYAGFISKDSERISTSLFLGDVRVY
jgi:Family of unknown function (DUF6266)